MDLKDVEKLGVLARIELSDEEKRGLLKDFEGILAYIKMIDEAKVDDDDIEHDLYNIWREDEERVREFSQELIMRQFPRSQGKFLKVKKIL